MTAFRAIVTRPAHDAERWVRQLQQTGIDAEALPLIEIAPVSSADEVQALKLARGALPGYAACLFVSGNAAEHFFKQNTPLAQSASAQAAINSVANDLSGKIPPGLRFMAPGPGTVAALLAAGIRAAQIDAPAPDAGQFDSEALWQVIGSRDWHGLRVLIVRGHTGAAEGNSSGRDWIASQWRAAGAIVDFVGVYRRRAPLFDEAQLQRARSASADGSVWLFSSSEALANLIGCAGLQHLDWSQARAVATHPRIAQAVRAAGWGVVVVSRPALQNIREALGSIESQHP